MARFRMDQYNCVVAQETNFGEAPAGFTPSKTTRIGNLDVSSLKDGVVEDDGYKCCGGSYGTFKAPGYDGISPGFDHYVEGTGVDTADTESPTETGLTWLIQSCNQSEPVVTTAAKATGTPTTIEIVEDVAAAHDPSLTVGIAAYTTPSSPGTVECRPYDYATDTMSLRLAGSEALAASDVVKGGILLTHNACPTTIYSNSIRFLNKSQYLNKEVNGQVGTFTIGSVAPNEVPKLSFTMNGADFEDVADGVTSDVGVCGTNDYGSVFAGAQILIGKYGATTYKQPQVLNVEYDNAGSFVADVDAQQESGIGGWTRDPSGVPMLKVTIPIDSQSQNLPPTSTETTWQGVKRDNKDSENLLHVMVQYGSAHGRLFCIYMPKARCVEWEMTDDNGLAYQTLTIVPDANQTQPVIMMQG